MQAIMLQMAAAKEFGDAKFNALDHLTVSMAHPDATAAMLGGTSEVVANFSSAPFQYRQMKNPNIRRLLTSTDLFDEPLSFNVIATTSKFRTRESEALRRVPGGAEGGDRFHQRRQEARGRDLSEGERRQDADRGHHGGARRPGDPIHHQGRRASRPFVSFMAKTGALRNPPADWREMFFPEALGRTGGLSQRRLSRLEPVANVRPIELDRTRR